MFPVLFKIGVLEIQTYGVLLAVAFLIGIYIVRKRAKQANENEEHILNVSFIIIIFSILGARLTYVIFHLSEFYGRWKYVFWPIQEDGSVGIGGLILLGGIILAIIASFTYLIYKKLDCFKYADIIIPALPLGIFLGRVGCFFNGCCFGQECHMPWAISFPENSFPHYILGNTPLHPTQLYEAIFNLLLFVILLYISKKINKLDGTLFGIFLIAYGLERFIIDFFRYYESQMFIVFSLNFNQIVSVVFFIVGILIIFKNKFKFKW